MSNVSAERTPDLSARERFGASFKAVVTAMRRLRGRETHPGRAGSISYAQYGLLFGLAERDRLSVRELGERVELTPATVTQMLDALQEGRTRCPASSAPTRIGGSSSVHSPEHGRELLVSGAGKGVFECRWQEALAGFSDEQLLTAAEVLGRVAEHFDHFDEVQ